MLNLLVEDIRPYGCLPPPPPTPSPFYESLSVKFPQVLECGFYPSTQKRGMSHTYLGKLKMCIACDLIVHFSWVIFWEQKKWMIYLQEHGTCGTDG